MFGTNLDRPDNEEDRMPDNRYTYQRERGTECTASTKNKKEKMKHTPDNCGMREMLQKI